MSTIRVLTSYTSVVRVGETYLFPASYLLGIGDFLDVTNRSSPAAGDRLVAEHEASAAQIVTLQADVDHGDASILHTEANADNGIGLVRWTALRTFLAGKGLTAAEINSAVGSAFANQTRRTIARGLITVLRSR